MKDGRAMTYQDSMRSLEDANLLTNSGAVWVRSFYWEPSETLCLAAFDRSLMDQFGDGTDDPKACVGTLLFLRPEYVRLCPGGGLRFTAYESDPLGRYSGNVGQEQIIVGVDTGDTNDVAWTGCIVAHRVQFIRAGQSQGRIG